MKYKTWSNLINGHHQLSIKHVGYTLWANFEPKHTNINKNLAQTEKGKDWVKADNRSIHLTSIQTKLYLNKQQGSWASCIVVVRRVKQSLKTEKLCYFNWDRGARVEEEEETWREYKKKKKLQTQKTAANQSEDSLEDCRRLVESKFTHDNHHRHPHIT